MGYQAEARAGILKAIVEDMPGGFWADLLARAQWVYQESYDSNVNDPRIRPTQAHFKTISDRFYFFETVLSEIAEANGAVALPEEIKVNLWRYTLVRSGRLSLTAKYVYTAGHMASAAEYRKQLAASNSFNNSPTLPFIESQPLASSDVINGIVLHGPVSRDFRDDGFRHLGFLHFAVPWQDFDGWVANFPITEILNAYESEVERRPTPEPVWKAIRREGDKSKGSA